jgi:hypothetical protein
MKRKSLVLSALLALLAVMTIAGQGLCVEAALGQIDRSEGQVLIVRSDGSESAGAPGVPLFPGDRITTGKDGRVWFTLQGGRTFRLGEEAEAALDELSSYEEEDTPVLRLALGYLWSKAQQVMGKPVKVTIQTPTAVIGVRGTEFDTVVSMDAGSAVAVDEGSVEVEAEEERVVIDQGRMTQVEIGGKPARPVAAMPKEKRDWRAWRGERIKRLFKWLPKLAPKLRRHFDVAVARSGKFTDRVNQKAYEVREAIKKVQEARQQRDRQGARRALQTLKRRGEEFKKMVWAFRKGANRVRSMARLSRRLEGFVGKNRARFRPAQLDVIESNLLQIAQRREELKIMYRETVKNIRRTAGEVRAFRKEVDEVKKRREQRRRPRR